MSIKVEPNHQYKNGTNANDKYNPIAPQSLTKKESNQKEVSSLLTNRIKSLEDSGYKTSNLGLLLTTKDWNKLISESKGKSPPFVVVSSGRAAWIRKGFQNGDAILRDTKGGWFEGIMDLQPLKYPAKDFSGFPSPPIYFPRRLGQTAKRDVYIFVHLDEYKSYCKELDSYPSVTVVGWNFNGLAMSVPKSLPKQSSGGISTTLTGFGASRFAAIEFCKTLYGKSGGQYAKLAWHFDDNVVGMSSDFGGLEFNEGELLKSNSACQGFAALPNNCTRTQIISWAESGGKDPRNTPGEIPEAGPIFQQAVLWNIDYLGGKKLNFGPAYVASAEDVSLSRFINLRGMKWTFAQKVVVMKEVASDDANDQGAQDVAKARRFFRRKIADFDRYQNQITLEVTIEEGRSQTYSISSFVHAFISQGGGNMELFDRASCQTVEQMTKAAIGWKLVDRAALDATFLKVKVTTELRSSGPSKG